MKISILERCGVNKIHGFVAMPIIIISAVLAVGVLGGLAYEYKNNQSVLSSINKNSLLAGISSIIETPYQGDGYNIQTFIGGSYGNGGDNLEVVVHLTNTSTAVKTFTWNNPCGMVEYLINDSNGKEVYSSGSGIVCTQEISAINISLQPNEFKDWRFTFSGTRNLGPSNYKIVGIIKNYGQAISEITIVAPSITVTSPNGGEKFSAGTNMTFSWSSQNYPSYAGVDINLFKKKSSPILSVLTLGLYDEYDFNASIARNYTNKYGQFGWTIPADYSSGEYKLEISCSRNQGYGYGYGQNCVADVSDKPFTISAVAPTTTVCDATAKAIVNSVGGCNSIDQSQYSNIYQACCVKPTKEILLSMLNTSLADGVIDSQEKTALLSALNLYLGQ